MCRFDSRHGQFFFFNDDGGASRSGTSKRKARALKRVQSTKPEGAKRLRMLMQSTKLEGAKQRRMRVQSTKPFGTKRPSGRAGMSAANIGASLHTNQSINLID